MRNPTGEEKGRSGFRQIEWIKQETTGVHKIARVIQHHDHHHDAPEQID